jgi:predicted DNA-binding transcriptional regulator YafY
MPAHDQDILPLLPTQGDALKWITTPEVATRLRNAGITVNHVKTVQRWLEKLEAQGVVVRQSVGNALAWQRKEGAGGIAARAGGLMTFDEALALQVLKRFSDRRIPAMVSYSLKSLFTVAEDRLLRPIGADGARHASWHHKVAVVDSGFQPTPPMLADRIFREVSNALFTDRFMELVYARRDPSPDSPARRQRVMPLGLVETAAGLVYLVARNVIKGEVKPNPTIYRLDRMTAADTLPEHFDYPADFVLEKYVGTERMFDFYPDGQIKLALRFQAHAARSVLDGRMAEDQTIKTNADGTITVRGTVMLSDKLRWWIRAFGPGVEVLSPRKLREEFAEAARQTAAQYQA